MISEGDLMPRNESAREARRDCLGFLESQDRSARDMMISPVVTVGEDADVRNIAELLSARRIKRVPVLSGGRIVGIVSRPDLVRAFASNGHASQPEPSPENIEKGALLPERHGAMKETRKPTVATSSAHADSTEVSAGAFRDLALNFRQQETQHRSDVRHQLADTQHKQAEQMMGARLSEASWQHMLRIAGAAAQKGEEEQLLLRFPCELCTDHGRAINAPDPSWPTTLRGLAAEVFMRWKKELQPQGFGLAARVVEFPDGVPGDIGLFLEWGRQEGLPGAGREWPVDPRQPRVTSLPLAELPESCEIGRNEE